MLNIIDRIYPQTIVVLSLFWNRFFHFLGVNVVFKETNFLNSGPIFPKVENFAFKKENINKKTNKMKILSGRVYSKRGKKL
jgi:hypothetical protein